MFRSSSSFDRLLERATSHLLLEPDWDAILNICDTIRSGDVAPKYAVAAIKKKFYSENPHVVFYALMVKIKPLFFHKITTNVHSNNLRVRGALGL